LLDREVDMWAEHVALPAMVALAVLVLVKSAQLAVWGVVGVQVVVCPMLAADRGSTSRRPPTNMLGMVGTSML